MKPTEVVALLSPLAGRQDIPQDAQGVLNRVLAEASSPLQYDLWIYRVVVCVLGFTVIATVIGGIFLAMKADPNIKLPDAIVAIGSAAVGALAGLLAPSPKGE
jgi:hypothetical protein